MKKKWAEHTLMVIYDHQKPLYWFEKLGRNFYYYYFKISNKITGKKSFFNFVYATNTQCTLQCKECHSYMPYFTKDMQYMSNFNNFKIELDKVLKGVDSIPSFRFQGGETLLTKDLAKMVEYACSKKQIHHIQIITNGTIIPSEELLIAMKNPKVLLSISDYSCNEELIPKLKYDKISKLCKQYGVQAKHWLTKAGDLWIGRNAINNEYKLDKNLAIKNLKACHCFNAPKVVMYYKGKLHICPPAVYFYNANSNFQIPHGEMVDVINTPEKELTKKINNFANKKYYYLCSRCNAAENIDVRNQPGVQIEHNVTQNL